MSVEDFLGSASIVARLLLGSVFLIAGLTKLPWIAQFAVDIQQYRILPTPLAMGVAYTLPPVEIALAVALFAGVSPSLVAGLSIMLLLGFVVAVSSALVRRLGVSCPCFGLLYRESVGWLTISRDLILITLASAIFVWGHHAPNVFEMFTRGADPTMVLLALLTVAVASLSTYTAIVANRAAGSGSMLTALKELRIDSIVSLERTESTKRSGECHSFLYLSQENRT